MALEVSNEVDAEEAIKQVVEELENKFSEDFEIKPQR